ncbi:MAG TPA: hypothetical protein VM889_14095 [Candidatus Thermoplasmatota archaeon]|nr:hypothetical protein [Candidatus Thermoplasmatota archaeon]
MRMKCAECDCVVEKDRRIVVCAADGCCCVDVPVAPDATRASDR